MPRIRHSALLLVPLALACGPDDPFDPNDFDVPDPAPTLLAALSGGGQTGGAGAELPAPIRVQVLDQFGQPVDGVSVTFSAISGGGSFSPVVVTTNTEGIAASEWTLGGTLGLQEAQATTDPTTTVARFTATAVAGAPATIQLGTDTLRFDALGDTARVSVTASDAFGNPIATPQVTWTSDNPNRASVNGGGLVTATGNGTTRVIASAGGTADTVVVIVAQVAADVLLEPAIDTLIGAGDSVALRARVFDPNGRAMSATVAYSSSATGVATVSATGVVTAVDSGTTTIIATAGAVADSTTIVVRIPAGIVVTPAADTAAAVGDTLRLTATVTDAEGDPIPGASVAWASLDTLLARVDRYGRVTARDTGNARIVATSFGFADTAIVSVAPPSPAPPRVRPASALRAPREDGDVAPGSPAPARETRRVASRHASRDRRHVRFG